jgi:DNA-binding NtrC family response regulator
MQSAREAAVGFSDRVLIVDDDAQTREWIGEVLAADGYQPDAVPDVAAALIRLRCQTYPVIVLDQHLPGLSGLDLLPGIRTLCPHTAVIMVTGDGTAAMYRHALEQGAFDLLLKPISMAFLVRTVRSAMHFARTLSPFAPGASVVPPGGATPR